MNTQSLKTASAPISQSSDRSNWLKSWWQHLCDRLATHLLERHEPIVTERQDAQGSYWQIDDPNTHRSIVVRSAEEAIFWIEQGRYR